MTSRGSRVGHRRMVGQRGSTAVESAIVTPLVIALMFGIIEMGFLFKDYLAVAGAVRAGVRIASASPRTTQFAQVTADNVARTGGAMNLNDVQQMWVYKVALDSDKPMGRADFADCDECVKFRWDTGTKAFVPLEVNWSASDQNACGSNSLGGPPDRIGVYLQVRHDAFTGLIFSSVDISEASIMTLEPMSVIGGCKP